MSELRDETQRLLAAVAEVDANALPELERLRLGDARQAHAVDAAAHRHGRPGTRGPLLAFDEESRILFDAVAPDNDAAHFQGILDRIGALLPGDEPLPERVEAFRQRFVDPEGSARGRVRRGDRGVPAAHVAAHRLARRESFRIEYVTDKPWSGYNWYEGDYFSLIQINTDLPIFIDRAVDLGCHEGYPGHHTFGVLVERELVEGRNWGRVYRHRAVRAARVDFGRQRKLRRRARVPGR